MRYRSLGVSLRKGLAGLAGHKLLVGILACAFFLRISGNLYDRGNGFHPDEHHYVATAVQMMIDGTLNPVYFENPPLYSYAILAVLYGLFGLRYMMGGIASLAGFITALPPTVALGLARALSALAGTTTCLLLFLIGRRFGGELAGLLAAGFYGVAFLSVRDAHFAVNDVPMVSLLTLAFLFTLRLLEGGRPRDLILGGLTAGLAAATKYNGGIALLPLLLACALRAPSEGEPAGAGRARVIGFRALSLLLLSLAGFLLGNPYGLLDAPAFLDGLTEQYGMREKAWRGQGTYTVPLLALRSLVVELGWPLLLFVPLAAALCLARGRARANATLLALSVVLFLVLYHSSLKLFFARFLLPCTPFIALICAWGIVGLRETPWAPWARRPVVLGLGVAFLIASPLTRSIYLDLILRRPDTRILAQEYLERVAPVESTIAQDLRGTTVFYLPRLNSSRFRLLSFWSEFHLLNPVIAPANYYLFSSFITNRLGKDTYFLERSLALSLERLGFRQIRFSPLRGGGEIPVELDEIYLPYRDLFRYERSGPTIVIYARPGMPAPPPPDNDGV